MQQKRRVIKSYADEVRWTNINGTKGVFQINKEWWIKYKYKCEEIGHE